MVSSAVLAILLELGCLRAGRETDGPVLAS
jgi:hypothetical protein